MVDIKRKMKVALPIELRIINQSWFKLRQQNTNVYFVNGINNEKGKHGKYTHTYIYININEKQLDSSNEMVALITASHT